MSFPRRTDNAVADFPQSWKRLFKDTPLWDVTPHILRHSFASIANDLGRTEITIAAHKDRATREIVGWAMDDHLRAELCERALPMAIHRRQPPRGLTHHSDRGVQHASASYQAILKRHGLAPSMSRGAIAWTMRRSRAFSARRKTNPSIAPASQPARTPSGHCFGGSRVPTTVGVVTRRSAT